MSKMNPEIKARWVAALRSGEYRQGKGYLNKNDHFCCLGVLCDLYAKDENVGRWDAETLGRDGDDLPSAEVTQWAGLGPLYDPKIDVAGNTTFCSTHNDNGKTFAQIADAIESQL